MGYSRRDSWKSIDWFTVLLYVIMIVAGWVTICGASYEYDMDKLFALSSRPVNQLIWMGISLSVAFSILMIERDFYEVFSYLIYAAIILLLVATIFLAPDIKGSRSWLVLGPIRLQPAEFAKFATALAVARLMGTYGFELARYKNFLMVLGLIFLPMIAEGNRFGIGLSCVFPDVVSGRNVGILFVGRCLCCCLFCDRDEVCRGHDGRNGLRCISCISSSLVYHNPVGLC